MIIFGSWPPSRLTVGVALVMTGAATLLLAGPYWIGVGLICAGVLLGWPGFVALFRERS